MRLLYCLFVYCAAPFAVLRLLWRSRKAPAYRQRIGERFACFDLPKEYQGGIWIHTVSVGEVIAAAPLIIALTKRYPDKKFIVTTLTPTGSERVKALLPKTIYHIYAPYDLPCAVKRFLNQLQPKLLILMETELWPNILHYCQARQIPCLLANARLSERSFRGYNRFQPLAKHMMQALSIIAAQAEPDAERFIKLGANRNNVRITGNVKFDMEIPASLIEAAEVLRQQLGAHRAIFIAASTHEGEDEQILEAFKQIKQAIPQALLMLVPRHLERFNKVAILCEKAGLRVTRRSKDTPCTNETDVFLGDTMGELRLFFGAADVAFIGGSLVPHGGHNMLESAAFNLPVLSGPHVFNFLKVSRLMNEAQALITVHNAKELAERVVTLLQKPELRQQLGQQGKEVVDANRGALEKHLQLVDKLLS